MCFAGTLVASQGGTVVTSDAQKLAYAATIVPSVAAMNANAAAAQKARWAVVRNDRRAWVFVCSAAT